MIGNNKISDVDMNEYQKIESAVILGDLQGLDTLLKYTGNPKAYIQHKSTLGRTLLHQAARGCLTHQEGAIQWKFVKQEEFNKKYVAIIVYLVQQGADVNAMDDDKMTPLLLAVDSGRSLVIIQAFLSVGADLTRKNRVGDNLFHVLLGGEVNTYEVFSKLTAQYKKELPTLIGLLNQGNDNSMLPISNLFLKRYYVGQKELLKDLLKLGVRINLSVANDQLETPLHYSCVTENYELTKTLLNPENQSAFEKIGSLFKRKGDEEGKIVSNPLVNYRDLIRGNTPLHYLYFIANDLLRQTEKFSQALEASPYQVESQLSMRVGRNESSDVDNRLKSVKKLIDLLLKHGADPYIQNNDFISPHMLVPQYKEEWSAFYQRHRVSDGLLSKDYKKEKIISFLTNRVVLENGLYRLETLVSRELLDEAKMYCKKYLNIHAPIFTNKPLDMTLTREADKDVTPLGHMKLFYQNQVKELQEIIGLSELIGQMRSQSRQLQDAFFKHQNQYRRAQEEVETFKKQLGSLSNESEKFEVEGKIEEGMKRLSQVEYEYKNAEKEFETVRTKIRYMIEDLQKSLEKYRQSAVNQKLASFTYDQDAFDEIEEAIKEVPKEKEAILYLVKIYQILIEFANDLPKMKIYYHNCQVFYQEEKGSIHEGVKKSLNQQGIPSVALEHVLRSYAGDEGSEEMLENNFKAPFKGAERPVQSDSHGDNVTVSNNNNDEMGMGCINQVQNYTK